MEEVEEVGLGSGVVKVLLERPEERYGGEARLVLTLLATAAAPTVMSYTRGETWRLGKDPLLLIASLIRPARLGFVK